MNIHSLQPTLPPDFGNNDETDSAIPTMEGRQISSIDNSSSLAAHLLTQAYHNQTRPDLEVPASFFSVPSKHSFEEERAEIEATCPDQDLARALFENQFQVVTEEEEKIKSGIDVRTKVSRFLREEIKNPNRKLPLSQAQADSQLNSFLKRATRHMPEYNLFNPETHTLYRELGELISMFRTSVLPHIRPHTYTSSQGETKIENITQAFNTQARNFLGQNPYVTKELLFLFLHRYAERHEQQKTTSSLSPKNDTDVQLREAVLNKTSLIYSCSKFYKSIVQINHDEEAFSNVLKILFTKPINHDNGTPLERSERNTLIEMSLESFGIFQKKNPEVFTFVYNYYKTFGALSHEELKLPKLHADIVEFQNQALQLLLNDDANRQRVNEKSGDLKARVEQYQAEEKAIRAQNKRIIEENLSLPDERQQELLPIPRIQHNLTNKSASSEALLEPRVRALLEKITTILDS